MLLPPTTKTSTVATEAQGENGARNSSEQHLLISSLKMSKRVMVNLQCMKRVQSVNYRSEKYIQKMVYIYMQLRHIIITLEGKLGHVLGDNDMHLALNGILRVKQTVT